MKKISLFSFLLFMLSMVNAQTKTSISILPMANESDDISKSDVRLIQESVVNALFSTKRFTIVDRQRLDDLEKEKKLQKTEGFMDNDTKIKDGVSIGASYLIAPNLISANNGYTLQLKVLNVSTGEILATDIITSNPKSYPKDLLEIIEDYNKKDKTDFKKEIVGDNDLDRLKINIVDFVNKNLPDAVGYSFASGEDIDMKTLLDSQKKSIFYLKPNSANYFRIGDLFKIPNIGKAVMVGADSQNAAVLVVYEFFNKKFKLPKGEYIIKDDVKASLITNK